MSADPHELVHEIERKTPYQAYLDAPLGLRNHWYPAIFSKEIAEGEVCGEMLLGERILFKRAGGKVYAVEDRCAHRGASFSARPECYTENTVTCWLHGFTYDVRDGKLVQIITEPDSVLIGRVAIKSYPVEELNGVVFVFIGDMETPPPLREDVQPKFYTPRLAFYPVSRNKVRGNWRLAAESGFDAAHIYGHRNSELLSGDQIAIPLGTYPNSKDAVKEQDGDQGPWGVFKEDDVNVWSATIEDVRVTANNADPENPPPLMDIVVGIFMPCGLEVDWFPTPKMMHFEWYIPIDEQHHMYMITHAKPVNDDTEEAAFFAECDNIYGPLIWKQESEQTEPKGDGATWGFNNFDAFGREQIQQAYEHEDYWHREQLYKPDYIITRWRVLVAKRMRGIQQWGTWANPRGWSPNGGNYDPNKGPGNW